MRCVLSLSVPKVPIFSRDVVLHWNGAVLAKKLARSFLPLHYCAVVKGGQPWGCPFFLHRTATLHWRIQVRRGAVPLWKLNSAVSFLGCGRQFLLELWDFLYSNVKSLDIWLGLAVHSSHAAFRSLHFLCSILILSLFSRFHCDWKRVVLCVCWFIFSPYLKCHWCCSTAIYHVQDQF